MRASPNALLQHQVRFRMIFAPEEAPWRGSWY